MTYLYPSLVLIRGIFMETNIESLRVAAKELMAGDTWWDRLIRLRDSYFCIEGHKADLMIIDAGSFAVFQEEINNHPNDAIWFQNCCAITVVPRIGKSEVVFYKQLKTL